MAGHAAGRRLSTGRAALEEASFVDGLRGSGPGNIQERRLSFADKLAPIAQQPWQDVRSSSSSVGTASLPITPMSAAQYSSPRRHSACVRMLGAPVQSDGDLSRSKVFSAGSDHTNSTCATQDDLERHTCATHARSDNTNSTFATQDDFKRHTWANTQDDLAMEDRQPRKQRISCLKTKPELDKEFQTVCVAACARAAELDKEFQTACDELAPDILKEMKKLQGQWLRKNLDEKEQDAKSAYLMRQRALLEDGARRVGCLQALTLALAASSNQGVVPETQYDIKKPEAVREGRNRRASHDACLGSSTEAAKKTETMGSLPDIKGNRWDW